MATSTKRVGKIRQIVWLKQVNLMRKHMNLRRQTDSCPSSYFNSGHHIPLGFIALYVGPECKCFMIPTRFLNLPVFVSLLKKAEEFGFSRTSGFALPCEIDEDGFHGIALDDFLKLVSEIGSECCNEATSSSFCMATPLLQKVRV
ncbi:hypothetical protein I3843_04G054700 [Carya illinoinensis]|uniref:Uncharacterized protein n=1 Tax=Carya illinoinensis TaxID=32201 RepID=A0A922JQN5_CARIL|nr:hypothetical protein I3842_04G060700 [Carya illinoinensis]KAG7982479.1 hypothetical protein I3843_04G054700 [Carya illinoinensis]